MPKIFINEKDFTNPGVSGEYSNYAVLIPGFIDEVKAAAAEQKPDANGIYEFNSVQAFMDTVGKVAPRVTIELRDATTDSDGNETSTNVAVTNRVIYHYGNQMAYELLSQGYNIVYIPLSKDQNSDRYYTKLSEPKFWEIFKDKSSYDFRFITHGLLESNKNEETDAYIALNGKEKACTDAHAHLDEISKVQVDKDGNPTVEGTFTYSQFTYAFDDETFNTEEQEYENLIAKHKATHTNGGEDVSPDAGEGDGEGEGTSPDTGEGEVSPANEASGEQWTAADETRYNELHVSIPLRRTIRNNMRAKDTSDCIIATLLVLPTDINVAMSGIEKAKNSYSSLKSLLTQDNITETLINDANEAIMLLATYEPVSGDDPFEIPGRGDCVALLELDEQTYVNNPAVSPEKAIITATKSITGINHTSGKNCAITVPSVHYIMSDDDYYENNKKFPGAFHYLACFMYSLKKGFKEWYASAGYSRGISSYNIDYTTVKLGEIAINALEPRNWVISESQPSFACNVIACFRGNYFLWGNRTAHPLGFKGDKDGGDLVASSFLNIRQLCATIKKQLYVACRSFTFDPNSDTLWVNFVNAIKPTLEMMKSDQGIRDYKIIKEAVTTKATLKATIRIIPIEAVEDFDLTISLEDSFGETTAIVAD